MTTTLVVLLSLALLGLAIMQTSYVYGCWRFLRQSPAWLIDRAEDDISNLPAGIDTKVALVLCLRGADPGLSDCLSGISAQNYTNFELHIVVDSQEDPALETVNHFFADKNLKPVLHVVQQPHSSCSLKCSAILEAVAKVPIHVPTLAFIDADTVPDPNWLRDLVTPLQAVNVGATTGNRWFSPGEATLGSYVRKIWNAAAIVQMDLYNIPWGGSLAIKRDVLIQCNLPELWQHSFCEDTLLTTALECQGLQVVRVPQLIAVNTESTSVRDSFFWITRQLLTVRLYHPKWILVKIHGLATTVGSVIAPLGLMALIWQGNQREFLWLLLVFLFFQAWNLLLLSVVERINLKIAGLRYGDQLKPDQSVHWPLQVTAYLLIQLIQPLACLVAASVQRVRWRGIEYEIGKRKIFMTAYVPYRKSNSFSQNSKVDSLS